MPYIVSVYLLSATLTVLLFVSVTLVRSAMIAREERGMDALQRVNARKARNGEIVGE